MQRLDNRVFGIVGLDVPARGLRSFKKQPIQAVRLLRCVVGVAVDILIDEHNGRAAHIAKGKASDDTSGPDDNIGLADFAAAFIKLPLADCCAIDF